MRSLPIVARPIVFAIGSLLVLVASVNVACLAFGSELGESRIGISPTVNSGTPERRVVFASPTQDVSEALATLTPTPAAPGAATRTPGQGDALPPGFYAVIRPEQGDLRVVDINGREMTRMPRIEDEVLAFSPDGSAVAFRGDDSRNITILDTRDRSRRYLGADSGLAFGAPASWSPDAKHLVVSGESIAIPEEADRSSLYLIDVDTGLITRITPWQGVEGNPAWAPDGKTIAFVADHRSGVVGQNDLFFYDAQCMGDPQECIDRTRWVRVPGFVGGVVTPAWSPDSQRLAIGCRDGGAHVCVLSPSSGDVQMVASEAGSSSFPAWSPDGEWILFSGNDKELYLPAAYAVRPDGTDRRRLSGDEAGAGVAWLQVK